MRYLLIVTFLVITATCHCSPVESERQASDLWMWNVQEYPHPKHDFERCGQSSPSTLCDPDKILTKDEANSLKDLIQRVQNKSPCLCKEGCVENAHEKGLVVGVALMNYHSLQDDQQKVVYNFSVNLRKKWNLGSCDNDLLILVLREARTGSIVHGEALEGFLSEETINDIYTDCKDHLETDHFYQGLESIINSLYDEINRNLLRAPGRNEDDETQTGNVGLTVGLVVGMACLCGLAVAGILIVRKQKRNNRNGFMYDGANGRPGNSNHDIISPIIKQHVVFPDAIYQPCSVEDSRKSLKTDQQAGSDEEEEHENSDEFYLHSLEENPAYVSADMLRSQKAISAVKETPNTTDPPAAVHYSNATNRNLSHSDENSQDVPV